MAPPCELSAGAASGAAASRPASVAAAAPPPPAAASGGTFEALGPASGVNPVPGVAVLAAGTGSESTGLGIVVVEGPLEGTVVVVDMVSEGAPVGAAVVGVGIVAPTPVVKGPETTAPYTG